MALFPKTFLQLLLPIVLVFVGKLISANAEGNSEAGCKIELHKRVIADGAPVQYINCHKREHSSKINARCDKPKERSDPESCPSHTFSERMSIVFWIVMASFSILTFVQNRAVNSGLFDQSSSMPKPENFSSKSLLRVVAASNNRYRLYGRSCFICSTSGEEGDD
ncbi:unnamed protein product [Orchesella dallaii]|uniref:Uncharacterized protein n=1 Tax=Orchesella dallaii TaxID=48710 RepID=A0ABP1RYG0_9HEXA